MRNGNKAPIYASRNAHRILGVLSKSALLDIAWNLASIGTDESEEEVLIRLCREAVTTCGPNGRRDRLTPQIIELSRCTLNSDPY